MYIDYSAEVGKAQKQGKPILALESTIITHGMPYPHNLETAKAVEQIARDQGAIPATIAMMNGKIKIGLSEDELETLARDKTSMKASVRDMAYVLGQKVNAGTTVAATLYAAHQAGIKVFATGGIGGVHRGDAMDISTDLIELARTPVAVVCAGAKAILDLPRTMELLETLGIPVVGYRTTMLPAFYTRSSEHKLPMSVNDVNSLANIFKIHRELLGFSSGMLIKNPIPEEHEIPVHEIEGAIQLALHNAESQKITGKEMTPFLLSEVAKVTEGRSLTANIALIKNNVLLGAKLAVELNRAAPVMARNDAA